MKQILLILPWLELGGADTFNLDLLAQLAAKGYRSTLLTTARSSHPWRELFAATSDSIVDLTAFSTHEWPARLVQIARDCGCTNVLVSHSRFGYHILPYLRAHLPTVAFVDYCHIEEDWGEGGFPTLSVRFRDSLDQQIVSSNHLRQRMIAHGTTPERVSVATTNIDADLWNPAAYSRSELRRALQLGYATPVVLYAARLVRQKQPLLALDVMRDVVRMRPDTVFLIAGDGQFAPYVRGFIRAHRLEQNIRMLGPQPAERMRELLAASDLFFLPSQHEGISLAIYEAMAMAVVPVSAAVGGQAELVTPETGILVEHGPHERQAYVRALETLLAEPDRRHTMGEAARQRITASFRLDQMGERMADLLEQAHKRRARSDQPTTAEALASAKAAVALAQAEAAHTTLINRPLRRWARTRFWQAVERGAWWLVPLLERLRWDVV